jgi:hypothetical protein
MVNSCRVNLIEVGFDFRSNKNKINSTHTNKIDTIYLWGTRNMETKHYDVLHSLRSNLYSLSLTFFIKFD